ncbi:MAG: hypothetical protein ACK4TA_22195, partial [Saprospiraceae bacterium]
MFRIILFSCIILIFSIIQSCQYPVDSAEVPDPQRFILIEADLTEHYGQVRVAYTLTDVNAD